MGFLKRLLGSAQAVQTQPARPAHSLPVWPPRGPITSWPVGESVDLRAPASLFEPTNRATVEVMGESHYQGTLERLAGGRTIDGGRYRDHIALMLPEPSNPYDHNAVRVLLAPHFDGATAGLVGYLSREDAVAYRPVIDRLASMARLMACRASLKGGWDRGGGDRGSFGVTLHLDRPLVLMADMDRDYGPNPCMTPAFAMTVAGRPLSFAVAICGGPSNLNLTRAPVLRSSITSPCD